MITEENRKTMLEYVVKNLSKEYNYENKAKNLKYGGSLNYIVIDKKKVLFLIDRDFAEADMNYIYHRTKYEKNLDTTFIVYKNGGISFRYGGLIYRGRHKNEELKHYTNEQINHMIVLNSAEQFIFDKYKGNINYYQPESANLKADLITHKFEPIKENPEDNFLKPKIHIWTEKTHNIKNFTLENGILVPSLPLQS